MYFKKDELDGSYPLKERLKVEKAKAQSLVTYWINEYISSHVNDVEDVPELVERSINVTSQLEALYEDKSKVLNKYNVNDFEELFSYIGSLEEQVASLYAEKDDLLKSFPDARSLDEVASLAQGMEEQLKSIYAEKESGKE
ncbi:MAG: hypothetical protein SFU98_19375 [Leptospiraceae bacterium]|nr:hypothetical protein [Leptospiraceae bacterium]